MTKHIARLGTAALFSALFALSAHAQQNQDSKWEAWLGCWRASSGPMRCVVPGTSPSAAFILTVDSGRVVARDTVDAGGAAHKLAEQGCAGEETAKWSDDNHRVFIHSDVKCGAGLKRAANGIVAITPTGEWLDVQTILVAANALVRTAHYRQVAVTRTDLPAELAYVPALLEARHASITAARIGAASSLDVANIVEAVHAVDTTSVQAWLVERGTAFVLNAQKLVLLADAGVPGSVTDVMIGASYPDHFALAPQRVSTTGSSLSGLDYSLSPLDSARIAQEYLYDRYRYRYGYGFGYSPFYAYGYSPYGYGGYYGPAYYGSTYYSGPVVTVKDGGSAGHGQVVKGRGYTSGSTTSTGSARDNGAFSGSSGASASSTSSAGGSGSASSSSSSGGGGDRTAHPRPPR